MTNLVRVKVVAPGGFTVTPETRLKLSDDLAAAEIRNLQSIPGDPKHKGPQPDLVDGCHKPVRAFPIRRKVAFDVDLSSLDESQKKAVEIEGETTSAGGGGSGDDGEAA